MLMPLNFLLVWLVGLLSIGVLGGGLYIIYEWYEGEVGLSYIATVPAASIRMKAELPNSQLVTLKLGGHRSLMEQNQQFAEAVSSFSVICSS